MGQSPSISRILAAALLCSLGGMAAAGGPQLPVARWDGEPESSDWTKAAMAALNGPAAALVETVPGDIADWCPGYGTSDDLGRKAFWIGLVSALAKHESTWRPGVSGGDGKWHGLLQISPATAKGYGCAADDAAALKDAAGNLTCGLRIMAATVIRDGVVAEGGKGVAADWGPFSVAKKRDDMANWTRAQPNCEG